MSKMSETLIEKVLSGKSKAHVFDHDTCATLWAKGYTDVRSGEHLHGYSHELVHYGTLSAIRTEKGEIIVNSQDWGSGWAKIPRIPSDLVKTHLPLTTLRDNLIDVYKIEIIEDKGWNDALFKVGEAHYLLGRDEQLFLVELIKPCATISEAYESMKPETVKTIENSKNETLKKEWPILRQGDLFFIGNPSAVDNDPPSEIISFQQSYKKKVSRTYEFNEVTRKGYGEGKSYIWYPQIKRDNEASRHYVNKVMETPNHIGIIENTGSIQQVTGRVRHPQHKTLKLEGWWIVLPNVVKRSITVGSRGGAGAD